MTEQSEFDVTAPVQSTEPKRTGKYTCWSCGLSGLKRNELWKHRDEQHPPRYELCDICGKVILNLRDHIDCDLVR